MVQTGIDIVYILSKILRSIIKLTLFRYFLNLLKTIKVVKT